MFNKDNCKEKFSAVLIYVDCGIIGENINNRRRIIWQK
jgi:hypothetical protein